MGFYSSIKYLLITFTGILIISSSCKKVEGCTDPDAINYNSNVTKDDNSCIYESGYPTPYALETPFLP